MCSIRLPTWRVSIGTEWDSQAAGYDEPRDDRVSHQRSDHLERDSEPSQAELRNPQFGRPSVAVMSLALTRSFMFRVTCFAECGARNRFATQLGLRKVKLGKERDAFFQWLGEQPIDAFWKATAAWGRPPGP